MSIKYINIVPIKLFID